MFTGIIQDVGWVSNINKSSEFINLEITWQHVTPVLHLGDSVAVNGVCLTVTQCEVDGKGHLAFQTKVVPESIRRTTLHGLSVGARVNLETSLTLSTPLGGHLVTGDVDGVARVLSFAKDGDGVMASFELQDNTLKKYMVSKGRMAVDGVSLTLAHVEGNEFTISLIPATFAHTIFQFTKTGDFVNVETDLIGKYVEKMCVPLIT